MRKMLCMALLGLVSALPAAAADPASIDKPTAVVGTSWRTRVTDGMTKALISEATYRISAVNDSEVEVSNEAGEVVLVLDAGTYAMRRTATHGFEPPLERVRYPLAVGNRWDVAYRYDNPQCGPTQSKLAFKVAAWEELTTPMGKLRVLRIESDGQWRNGCGADRQAHKHWMLPDLGVPVRQESTVFVQGRIFSYEVHELQSFTRP